VEGIPSQHDLYRSKHYVAVHRYSKDRLASGSRLSWPCLCSLYCYPSKLVVTMDQKRLEKLEKDILWLKIFATGTVAWVLAYFMGIILSESINVESPPRWHFILLATMLAWCVVAPFMFILLSPLSSSHD
jgi:hypothetical protein